MRFLISLAIGLLLTINSGTAAGGRRNSPSSLQRSQSSWRMNSGYSDYDQIHGSNADDQEIDMIDDNADEIQQTVNNEFEDISSWNSKTQRPPVPVSQTLTSPGPEPVRFQEGQPEIKTATGTIRGKRVRSHNGKTVYAFLGIPFAKPPVGELRFKRPVKAGRFETPFEATELPNTCIQDPSEVFSGFAGEEMWNPNTNISEDCLYLNIWVPEEVVNNKEQVLVSVLFWIYGGGFFSGTSTIDNYNGVTLASQESVIVVSTQYRIGPLGFLYLGTDDAPGNMGFWDQNLALKWTHEHIESFGGNPETITLFGESAGSVSVSYHLLSPASRTYFKRAVMMSAVPTTSYSYVPSNILRNRSYKLAKLAGCDIRKPYQEIVDCLRNLDPHTLGRLQWRFYKKMLEFAFAPTIDGKFLDDLPANIIHNGEAKRADLMIGTVDTEGSYFVLYQYLKYFYRDKPTSVSRDRFVEVMREIFNHFTKDEQDAIITYYTNWEHPDDGFLNQQRINEAVGDYYFVCPSRDFADSWSNRGLKVFYYHFTQRSSSNPWAEWMGVMHGDEIEYMFGHPLTNANYTQGEKQLSTYMMKMLANFAKAGVPSKNWERYTSEVPVYLDLNATKPTDASTPNRFGPRANHCTFWSQLLPGIHQAGVRDQRSRNFRQLMHHQHCDRSNCDNRGIHGGQGFHWDETSGNSQSCGSSMNSPVAAAVPKYFGQNNHVRQESRQHKNAQMCRTYCQGVRPTGGNDGGNNDFDPTPIPV